MRPPSMKRYSSAGAAESFRSAEEHLSYLKSQAALPKGFSVNSTSFRFHPAELPSMDASMNLTLIQANKQACQSWAAVFTKNAFPGAPVILGREMLRSGKNLKGVVVNNKISNVRPKGGGVKESREVSETCLKLLLAQAAENNGSGDNAGNCCVLPSSTGVIGWGLPIRDMVDHLPQLCDPESASDQSILHAAEAIMTTDLYPKVRSTTISLGEQGSGSVVGIAKGAGMIEPNMATMLVYILTDIPASKESLQAMLTRCVDRTFNCISVDSDQSTSDTVVAMSSGEVEISDGLKMKVEAQLEDALFDVCDALCEDVVRNGEGVQHVMKVEVSGSPDFETAKGVGKAIVNSPLFKCAVWGNDPNLGRMLSAIGDYIGTTVQDPTDATKLTKNLRISIGDAVVYENEEFCINEENESYVQSCFETATLYSSSPAIRETNDSGTPTLEFSIPVTYPPHQRCVNIYVDMGVGSGNAVVRGADLSYEYVKENGDYRS